MTLRAQANTSAESSSGSGSDSSGSGGSSSSSGSGSGSGSGSSSSDSDSSASDSPEPRQTGAKRPRSPRPGAAPARPAVSAPLAPAPAAASESVGPKSRAAEAPERRPAEAEAEADAERPRPPSEERRPPPRRRPSSSSAKAKATATRPGRPPQKPRPPAEPERPPKKKSIFSPDNSSESDREAPAAEPAPKTTPPARAGAERRGRRSAASAPEPRPAPEEDDARSKGAVPKRPAPAKAAGRRGSKFASKEIVSSCTSTDAESTASASSSDAESDAGSPAGADRPKRHAAAEPARPGTGKADPPKSDKNSSNKESVALACTDSDVENTKPASNVSNVTRKSTRSASARKSRHVVGKALRSDTESETDNGPTKRSLSKSPVKRATVPSKGPTALCPVKSRGGFNSSLAGLGLGSIPRGSQTTTPASPRSNIAEKEELRCSLPGCDSLGHLSGRLDRHFTIEACPMYHNTTAKECRDQAAITLASQETRRKAQQVLKARKTSQPSLEHRAYQLKVKEMRSKWKPPASTNSTEVKQEKDESSKSLPWPTQQEQEAAGEREPILTGFVPDYDLSLFREAQAAAAFKIEEELKNMPSTKGTRYVCMGKYRMEAWYQSPYPPDAARLPQLYLCEFCLNHHTTVTGITRHRAKCVWRHPPGDEVYRKGKLGVWQVDGRRHKQYCQQLCLLAKFFLDHKTLYYDVEPFLFYVMTLADSEGCHTVGYFSKEKNSLLNYNVSCILTLPPYQRQGYGRLLIDFSYLLTRVEGKIGSPEKPLSDLGLISYRSYWKDVLLQYLCDHHGPTLSIKDLSQSLAINSYDIVSTLQALGMMKYWKGKHIILKKQDVLDEYIERTKRRGHVKQIDASCLKWTPFVPPSSQGGG